MNPTTTLGLLWHGATVAASDDAALLARFVLDRDEVAFTAIVARHGPLVWATARAILGNDHDAADVFQTTFLTLARRATTIRDGCSLAAWLHRVAHRSAVHAGRAARRRQRIEKEAAAFQDRPAAPDRAADVRSELARLPRSYAVALILCDLERLTYAEAAARVGCTEAALRNRLARGRQRLRARLEVGVMPAALVRSAVEIALRSSSGRVAVLAGGGMLANWLRVGGVVVVMGGLLVGGIVAGVARHRGKLPVAADDGPDPVPVTAPRTRVEPLVVRGRVVSPAGVPVAGATVTLFGRTFQADAPVPTVASGADGRFAIPISPQVIAALPAFRPAPPVPPPAGSSPPDKVVLVATAPGFGVGWADGKDGRAPVEVRLVAEGPPITGRVLDRAGQPVVGARVATAILMEPKLRGPDDTPAEALAAVLARRDKMGLDDSSNESFPVTLAATTDAAGRFAIPGAGAERMAIGFITGPTIARTMLSAVTHPGLLLPPIPTDDRPETDLQPTNGVDWTVEPTRIITGTVRAAGSGLPLRGWKVTASRPIFLDLFGPTAESQTDAAGHFWLAGLPEVPRFVLSIAAPAGQPYLDAIITHDAAPGREPVMVDVPVERGVVVRGRVTDPRTGEPITGLVTYFHFAATTTAGMSPTATDAEGQYQITVPPGHNLICFDASDRDRYRLGQWSQRLTPAPDPLDMKPDLLAGYESSHHALAEIQVQLADPAPTVDLGVNSQPAPVPVAAVNLAVAPRPVIEFTVVSPDGQPLAGTEIRGTGDRVGDLLIRQDGARVRLGDFGATDVRRITARDRPRKLAGAVTVNGATDPPPILKLESWGEVRGRVVTPDGPLGHAQLKPGPRFRLGPQAEPVDVLPGTEAPGGITTDADGWFHIVGLVPGTHYGASVADEANTLLGDLLTDLVVRPGEIQDLGIVVVLPPPQGQTGRNDQKPKRIPPDQPSP